MNEKEYFQKIDYPVYKEAAKCLGLPDSVLVFSGEHDQYCAALGAGLTENGRGLTFCRNSLGNINYYR